MSAHLAVEKAAAKKLPYPLFYHVEGDSVVAISTGVTDDKYDSLNIDAYVDIASKLKVPFLIMERKRDDNTLQKETFGEVFDLGKSESDLFEGIRFPELFSQSVLNRTTSHDVKTFALGAVDPVFLKAVKGERLPSRRHDFEGYAIIDFETTGFNPDKTDRAIEIAIVHLSPTGEYQDHWDTLVNPEGVDAGATHIHRITNDMLTSAPTIDDVILGWGALLQNRKVLSHNKSFDHKFLKYEFLNAGYEEPLSYEDMLCSLIWARKDESQYPTHKLIDCCTRSGIELTGAHEAIYDTLATSKLVKHYLEKYGEEYPLTGNIMQPSFLFDGGLDQIENFVSRSKTK